MPTASNGRRLIRLEEHIRPPCKTCASWPAVMCIPDPDTPAPYPGRCPDCGRQLLTVIGVNCDLI